MKDLDALLKEKKIVLPSPATPVANYLPFSRSGALLIISGQLPFDAAGRLDPLHCGKVGATVTPTQGRDAARLCALNILAQAKTALGSLNHLHQCLRLGGFINVADGFDAIAPIMNGASDLMVEILGEQGRHARTTIGVASLPLNACIEVEALFSLHPSA
jgi:enamine deaminase RidA (YjgF/YER057c/UK114 family)